MCLAVDNEALAVSSSEEQTTMPNTNVVHNRKPTDKQSGSIYENSYVSRYTKGHEDEVELASRALKVLMEQTLSNRVRS